MPKSWVRNHACEVRWGSRTAKQVVARICPIGSSLAPGGGCLRAPTSCARLVLPSTLCRNIDETTTRRRHPTRTSAVQPFQDRGEGVEPLQRVREQPHIDASQPRARV